MKPINEYVFNPDPSIGGAIVPIVGPPGCGKTNGLVQLAIDKYESGMVPVWRGTEQAQWASLLANDVPVKLWNHEAIDDFEAFVSRENGEEDIDLEEHVEIETWSNEQELIKSMDNQYVNVVNVPGINGDTSEKYFFRRTWVEIVRAVKDRRNVYNFFALILDEVGDLWPCQQQLRKPFYGLVAEELPSILAQLRKNNCFLYVAGHSTHDMHYFVWKIKSNTIMYMAMATVKKNLHSEVDQGIVNSLDRGQFVVPPKDRDKFDLAYEAEDLEWVGDGYFRVDWNAECPDLLEQEEKAEIDSVEDIPERFVETITREEKKKYASYMYEELDMSYREIGDVEFMPGKSTVHQWVSS